MNPRTIAQIIAAGRIAIGAGLVASPPLVTGRWLGEGESRRPGARVMGTGLGGRDVALGAGVLASLAAGDSAKPWLLGSAAADAADLLGTLRSAKEIPTAGVVLTTLIAGGAAAAGVWLATQDL